MKNYFLSCAASMAFCTAQAQEDTIREIRLEEVIVKAFEQNRSLKNVPAAVNYVGPNTIDQFNSTSIVSAINTTPGVRLEERSPGSYRVNIRGSALRSPFGVRNVKVYYNDLPFTDPGGQTYLNSLGYYNYNSVEVLKGPGSSLYGAGTGGVMLVESLNEGSKPGVMAEYTGGSFGLHNVYGSLTTGTDKVTTRTSYQHQQSNGYRNQSGLERDILSWNGIFRLSEKRVLKTTFLYSDLYYETPGALTLAEFNANPKASRPGSPAFPSAEAAKAAVAQRTFVAGASYTQQILSWLQNKSVLYGAFNQLQNANIRGYDKTNEPHVGGRSVFFADKQLGTSTLSLHAGAEWQQGFANAGSYKNKNGQPDTVRYTDDISNRQSFYFAQASIDVNNWLLTAGASFNELRVNFQRFSPGTIGQQKRKFNNELAPRVSLMKTFNNINVYTSVSKGFSPPSTSELLPTGGTINLALNAEEGTNYDIGFRGNFFKTLYVDVNAFIFSLNNTIVQRRDAGGGDFFTNAGETSQKGVETYVRYNLFQPSLRYNKSFIWLSHTWHHFEYKNFKQVNNDYSGNKLPGIPAHTISAGATVSNNKGFSGTINYLFNSKTPLNDGNTAYADRYHLLGLKAAYNLPLKGKAQFKLFAGADNLLDETYSLGNDINGFGGRYYNAAPGRNYFAGLAFNWQREH